MAENTWLITIKNQSHNREPSSKTQEMEGRAPFRDITNVHSTTSPKGNQRTFFVICRYLLLIIHIDRLPWYTVCFLFGGEIVAAVAEQNDPFAETKNTMQMNSSQRKRYRDRDRYLQMTPYQRKDYLQRNREHKRMRRECSAICSNTQPAPRQKNTTKYSFLILSMTVECSFTFLIYDV